jgi:hypothetical protein
MSFMKKLKKAVKKVAAPVKKVAKVVGKTVKKATAVGLAASGTPMGMKAASKISKSMGMKKGGGKATLKLSGQVAKGTSKAVQIAGTAVGTIFLGPTAGAAIYRAGALNKQLVDREVAKAKGTDVRKVNWGKQIMRGVMTVGGVALGSAALGAFSSGGGLLAGKLGSGILDSVMGRGSAGADQSLIGDLGAGMGQEGETGEVASMLAEQGAVGSSGEFGSAGGGGDLVGSLGETKNWLPLAAGAGLLMTAGFAWYLS